jgi:hypothetical protein
MSKLQNTKKPILEREQLIALARHIETSCPGFDFLVLLVPKDDPKGIAISSNIPREVQPMLAQAFVEGINGLGTGETRELLDFKTH